MGLFDLFRSKESAHAQDRDLARLQKMITNKLSQNLDREDALYRLSEMASPAAAKVLLIRFSWNLDPSIKDQEEKEVAVRGIVAAGEGAVPAIRSYCVRAETLSWPLKALRLIVGEGRIESELLSLLDDFDTDYTRDPAAKVQLMKVLSEFHSDEVRVAVQPFLHDVSEEVRFSAASTVLGCAQAGSAALLIAALVAALISEESLRVKNRILVGIVESGWKVSPDSVAGVRGACPPGFRIAEDGAVTGSPVG